MQLPSLLTLSPAFVLALACAGPGEDTPVAAPGAPLPGLSKAELARFEEGRAWFDYAWTPDDGLGPLYIQNRCSSCHDLPELGGTGVETLSLMIRFDSVDGCDPLEEEGGPVQQERSTPLAPRGEDLPRTGSSGRHRAHQGGSSPWFDRVGFRFAAKEPDRLTWSGPDTRS